MTEATKEWDGETVRKWLDSRIAASRSDQDRADRQGRGAQDDYDKAAAEEWVCRIARNQNATDDPKRFGAWLKSLLDRDEFSRTGVHDERKFDREVRACIRKIIRMAKTNTGFENTLRYQ